MPGPEMSVSYHAVDSLPGGVPVMFVASCARQHLEVILSSAASVAAIASAMGPMYAAMSETAAGLFAVA